MQVARLAVRQDDADILLKEKNQLDDLVLDKYRTAGRIAQTALQYVIRLINDSYHLHKTDDRLYSSQELCVLGDSMISKLVSACYTNTDKVREKGISHPVTIDVNEYVANLSPEIDSQTQPVYFQAGDAVTISLGVHIDGYTALVSHTVVIFPPGVTIDNELKPEAPLNGSKADAIVACTVATNAVVSLLGLAVYPEKMLWIPELASLGNVVTGATIRELVDRIAKSFGCVVIPGSKVRRTRRFLAGQAEGVVAERDFKGVVWDESTQEEDLLKQTASSELIVHDGKRSAPTNVASAIPTDEFVVEAGEVYNVDLRMCGISEFKDKGLVTLQEDTDTRPTVFVRDVAITHYLKLNNARLLLKFIDNNCLVYPVKLAHACESFPVDYEQGNIAEQLDEIRSQINSRKLGCSELVNRYLLRPKPVQVVKYIPFSKILTAANPTGKHGIDSARLTLPGREVPLPGLGISALKLRSLMKFGEAAPAVARESTSVLLDSTAKQVIRLTGGENAARTPWVHSQFSLGDDVRSLVAALYQLAESSEFKLKEVQPMKLNTEVLHLNEQMETN